MPQPTPVIFLALGGAVFAMVYGSSRPWIYQCEACEEVFKKHSLSTRMSQPILWFYVLIYVIFVSLILLAIGAALVSGF